MKNPKSRKSGRSNGHGSPVPIYQKYGVIESVADMLRAVMRNPVSFIVSVLVALVLAALAAWVIVYAAINVLLENSTTVFASLGRIIAVVIALVATYTLLYALIYAFMISCISYSLSGKNHNVVETLKKGLLRTPRVLRVNILVAIIAYWPIAVLIFMPIFMLTNHSLATSPLANGLPVFLIAAFIWAVIAHLRYALAPYVAVFEPEIPVMQTLKRSRSLLKNNGQWFLFKGILLLIGILIFLGAASGMTLKELERSDNVLVNIIYVGVSIVAEGALVMLYLNRTGKQGKAKKSSFALIPVAVVVGAILGVAVWGALGSERNRVRAPYTYEALNAATKDIQNKTDILIVYVALEDYYDRQGHYPSVANMASPQWGTENLMQGYASNRRAIEAKSLTDDNGKYINSDGSDYTYTASPDNCTQCAAYVLKARQKSGDPYTMPSFNKTVRMTTPGQ